MGHERFGLLYEPSSEVEVYVLFGILMPHLREAFQEMGFAASEYYIDECSDSFPDCILLIDGKKIRVEFELYSHNFHEHGHDPEECDLIVCWKHTWIDYPKNLKILELRSVHKKLVTEKGLRFIVKDEQKYPPRPRPWTFEEFMEALKENVSEEEYQQLREFIEEIRNTRGITIQMGKGERIPTLNIGPKRLEGKQLPLGIDATGKASIVYYNVNVKPHQPLFSEVTRKKIWQLLGEPKTRDGRPKKWHYIETSDITELVSKMREIVSIMLENK